MNQPPHDQQPPMGQPSHGPPPAHPPAQHSNETPLPDYNIPAYQPQPQFAQRPDDSELYDDPAQQGRAQGQRTAGSPKASWTDRLASFGQQVASTIGTETFLPTSLDKECDKAARILRSFCKDGIYRDSNPSQSTAAPNAPKHRVLMTIPSKVISEAVGLAIFTTARAGFHLSGATGSGVLIARRPDGSWSPPSGIQVHSVGAGFVFGIDVYDCVVVINSKEALNAFTQTRMSLGADMAVTAGPWGTGGSLDIAAPTNDNRRPPAGNVPPTQQGPYYPQGQQGQHPPTFAPPPQQPVQRQPSPMREAIRNAKPVYSYVKSRGFYVGVAIDGTVVTERKDANAAFYGARVSVSQILQGQVPPHGPPGQWPGAATELHNVLRGAEGWHGQQLRGEWQGAAPPQQAAPDWTRGQYGSKAEEAAAEARVAQATQAAQGSGGPAPPGYVEETETLIGEEEEQPPAYVDDGVPRPGVGDTKTGQH